MRFVRKLLAVSGAAVLAAACDGPTGFTASVLGSPGGTGTITGAVTADGAGLGGVSVLALSARRDSTLTDGSGAYRFNGVPAGQYTVTVQVPLGFQMAAGQSPSRTVGVVNGGTANANFALQRNP